MENEYEQHGEDAKQFEIGLAGHGGEVAFERKRI